MRRKKKIEFFFRNFIPTFFVLNSKVMRIFCTALNEGKSIIAAGFRSKYALVGVKIISFSAKCRSALSAHFFLCRVRYFS